MQSARCFEGSWGNPQAMSLLRMPTCQEVFECRDERGDLPVLRAQLQPCAAGDTLLADVSAVALLFCSVLGMHHCTIYFRVYYACRWQVFIYGHL